MEITKVTFQVATSFTEAACQQDHWTQRGLHVRYRARDLYQQHQGLAMHAPPTGYSQRLFLHIPGFWVLGVHTVESTRNIWYRGDILSEGLGLRV